ncbi:hypothetical protein HO173_002131 [Letharia columbiana]|uniref:Uncharacterized protein n=1 Tax=Letharia columbiana TaxID=112416 RepID=A0A8H6L8E7_9LECA|nr:uncharacterized protein HO173_002131 [Letharia columbiana]KAF6239586.1 hypothetical protein HO173_002131 [Letharia columbiana]
MTDSTAKGHEPEAGNNSEFPDSDTIAHKKGFLPLLSDNPQQRQIKTVFIDESNVPSAPRTPNEKRFDPWTSGHAQRDTLIPLLPDRGTHCSKQSVPGHGPNIGSVSPRSLSAGVLNIEGPSQEHREHVAGAVAQKNDVRLTRSKPVRHYEWPLIINGVYQGEGPLPSCRIEDNGSPTKPKPYAWPLIILHRARSVEDGDQLSCPSGEEANKNAAGRKEKVEKVKTDDKSTDEARTTDGVSAKL